MYCELEGFLAVHETLQMMNLTDEEVNLGLAMDSTNFSKYSIKTRFINSTGAGVNADSRNNLAFAASDPLSELVWSPHKGLSLKRTNSRPTDKKPLFLWNMGTSSHGPSSSHSMSSEGNRDANAVDQGNETMSQTMLLADDMCVNKAMEVEPLKSCEGEVNLVREEEAGSIDAIQKEENCLVNQEEDLCSQNVQSAGIAEIGKENSELQPRVKLANEATSATGVVNENKRSMPHSIPSHLLKKPGSPAENDLCDPTEKDEIPRENSPAVEGSQMESRIRLYKEKGKEKALSEGDIHDSHGSDESSNGTGLFPKGIKRQSSDEGVIQAGKRMKKPVHASPGSMPVTKPDSSFMNWMSNMVKGSSDFNKEDYSSFPLPLACSNEAYGKNRHDNFFRNKERDMGFQAVFESLYSTAAKVLNTGIQKEINSTKESREVMVDDKKSLENKQIIICDKGSNSLGEEMNIVAERASPETPVASVDVPEKSNLLTNLWITRFCNKNPRSEKCREIIQDTIECSTFCPKTDLDCQINALLPIDQKSSETKDDSARFNSDETVDLKSKAKLRPITPSQKFNSEAMASVLARRLDALKHNMPSENDVIDNQKPPLCDIVPIQNTAAFSQICRAIKNLRLSRADILRYMNSDVSFSHLNGFFLRLRIGKLEAGLERASYYVACIAGDAREANSCTSKTSILVDVGGIKSSVTSQYISNHDFLEDEIKAWWCRIVESGCRVPTLDELNSKFNDKRSLGF